MTIWRDSYLIDFLKETQARISSWNKWLIWTGNEWAIYERKAYQKKSRCLYTGELTQEALDILKDD